jgi:hypothetical protein
MTYIIVITKYLNAQFYWVLASSRSCNAYGIYLNCKKTNRWCWSRHTQGREDCCCYCWAVEDHYLSTCLGTNFLKWCVLIKENGPKTISCISVYLRTILFTLKILSGRLTAPNDSYASWHIQRCETLLHRQSQNGLDIMAPCFKIWAHACHELWCKPFVICCKFLDNL